MIKKTVLIIGGGAAGHQVAFDLRDEAQVVLVDPKTYWEVPMAVPRLLVDPESLAARMRYDSFLGAAQHVQGKVVAMTDDTAEIAMADGSTRTQAFDYAVIASGSDYIDPLIKAQALTESDRANELTMINARLLAAHHVVVAGGGPVGIETAAELCETLPHLAVTVVHGEPKILDRAPGKFAGWAQKSLEKKGVTFVLGDLVTTPALGEQPTDGVIRTAKGRVIKADVVIWAVGTKPTTGYVASSFPEVVQRDGLLKVDGYLRLEGHPKIFVAGDVTNLPEGRLAIIGGLHAKSIVASVKALLAADSASTVALKPYKPALPGKGMGKMMIVTLGRHDGLTSLPFGQFRAGFMARMIKSRDMLVGMSRKAVNLPV